MTAAGARRALAWIVLCGSTFTACAIIGWFLTSTALR